MFEGQGHQRKLLLNLVGATSSGGFKVSLSVIYRNVMQCVMLPLRPFHIMHMLHCVSVYDTNGNDFSQLVMIIRNVARLGWYHLWDACQQNRVRIVRRISFLYNNFSEDHRPATLVYGWSTVSFCVFLATFSRQSGLWWQSPAHLQMHFDVLLFFLLSDGTQLTTWAEQIWY